MSSMYINIPIIEVINIIKDVGDTSFVNTTIKNETPNLSKDVEKQNYFSSNGKHCIQIRVINGRIYTFHFLIILFDVYSKN